MKGEESNKDKKWVEYARREILEEGKWYGGGKLPFDLTSQEKKIIADPVLDTCSSLSPTAIELIRIIREANNWNNYLDSFNSATSSCLAGLKNFRDAPVGSDKYKCVQAAKNNGDLLNKAISLVQPKYLAKSQELRGLITRELDWWVLGSSEGFESVKPRPHDKETIWQVDKSHLTPEHYQEIRKLLIENIKQNPKEWKYQKKVGWLDEKTGDEWYVSWVLENTKNPQRFHEVNSLTAKERQEISQALKINLPKSRWELEAEQEKQRVLNNPDKWILGPNGQIIAVESLWGYKYGNRQVFDYNNVFKTNGLKRKDDPLSFDELNPQQFGEIQQIFLDEIKSNPHDWKIEQEGGLWVIKHKSGRRHYKNVSLKDGKDEWWEEAERILTGKSAKNEVTQNPKLTSKNNFPTGILIVVGVILGGGLILIALMHKRKKKKRAV